MARDDKVKFVKYIPNKGNVKEVREHGVHNAIFQAFECRMKPNLLVGSYPHTQADLNSVQADGDGPNREGSTRNVTTVRVGGCVQVKPSKLLECPLWGAGATRLLELHKRNDELCVDPGADISNKMKLKADSPLTILQGRFKKFLKKRKRDDTERSYQVRSRMSQQAGQSSVPDLSCYVKCAGRPLSKGAYLYLDRVR